MLLAPTVNLHRSPVGGRVFECFSEDPLLTGRIGAAYVRGLQAEGVAATVKHFVANDSETERFTLDAQVGARALRELYMAPFELILAEHPWAVMAAYNRVNGVTMTESPLLRDVLEGRVGLGRAGDVRLGRGALDRGRRQRRAGPRDAGPVGAVRRRAGRRGARRARERGRRRRQGPAPAAPRRARRRARGRSRAASRHRLE